MIDIYRKGFLEPKLEEKLEAIEKVLGFKLFIWQKTYIEHGTFRRYGATTAKIIRELIMPDEIIDFSRRVENAKQGFYRKELLKIKKQLEEAGIETNPVARNHTELRTLEIARYEREFSTNASNDYKRPGSGSTGRESKQCNT